MLTIRIHVKFHVALTPLIREHIHRVRDYGLVVHSDHPDIHDLKSGQSVVIAFVCVAQIGDVDLQFVKTVKILRMYM